MSTYRRKLRAVIAIGNQKGGVGKSTNTVHLAAALGERGYKSLIIDLDPAAGATKHLGVPTQSFAGTLEMLTTDDDPESFVISKKMPKRVHLIPSRSELTKLDEQLSKFIDKTRILDQPIKVLRPRYDFIFIDTPPNPAAITTVAAYCVAEWFLLSSFPHPLAVDGLQEALKDIKDVREMRNPDLEVLGVVFTCVDGRTTKRFSDLESLVVSAFPKRKFQTITSQAIALPEVSDKGKTLFQMKQFEKHKVTWQYRYLAAEIEQRILNREAFIAGELEPLNLDNVAFPTQEGFSITPPEDEEGWEETFEEEEALESLVANE